MRDTYCLSTHTLSLLFMSFFLIWCSTGMSDGGNNLLISDKSKVSSFIVILRAQSTLHITGWTKYTTGTVTCPWLWLYRLKDSILGISFDTFYYKVTWQQRRDDDHRIMVCTVIKQMCKINGHNKRCHCLDICLSHFKRSNE